MPFSQYLATEILDWFKGGAMPTALSTVFLTVHSGDPGVAGTSNNVTSTIRGDSNRVSITTSTLSTIGAASGGGFQVTNGGVVQVSASAAAGATVTHFGIWDANSGGNFLASGQLTSSVAVITGDTVQFNIGAMAIKVV